MRERERDGVEGVTEHTAPGGATPSTSKLVHHNFYRDNLSVGTQS